MEGTGELSVYHGNLFLGSLRQDRLTTREFDALSSLQVLSKVVRGFTTAAAKIEAAIDDTTVEPHSIRQEILRQWSDTVARLCIGLRRIGTGGALLFSPAPHRNILDIKYEFVYNRLRDGFVLGVLDSAYLFTIEERVRRYAPKPVPSALVTLHDFADADADDRTAELAGAVRLVTSLAAVDGVVLLTPSLEVMAFGAKISAASTLGKVYDGRDFGQRGTRAITIDMSRFGTRHASVLQYCRADRNAIGVIVSQDGNVRLATSVGRSLVMWDDVKLLGYDDDYRRYLREEKRVRRYRAQVRHRTKRGYTSMPKTFEELLRYNKGKTGMKRQ